VSNAISVDQAAILARERHALDQWSQGRVLQYFDRWADDVTYFDDIGAHRRIDGIAGMRAYAAGLEGKVPAHRYDLVDPKVQICGDVGIVTLRYEPSGPDGTPLQRWKATGCISVPAVSGASCMRTGRW
jgi:hypothetical protein